MPHIKVKGLGSRKGSAGKVYVLEEGDRVQRDGSVLTASGETVDGKVCDRQRAAQWLVEGLVKAGASKLEWSIEEIEAMQTRGLDLSDLVEFGEEE